MLNQWHKSTERGMIIVIPLVLYEVFVFKKIGLWKLLYMVLYPKHIVPILL